MPRRLQFEPHLSSENLKSLYKSTKSPTEKSHWHILWQFSLGKTTQEISDFLGISLSTIRKVIHRYNEFGPESICDKRRFNKGAPTLLTYEQIEELKKVLEDRPPDGGLWSGPKVAKWMSQKLGREICRQRAYDYLKKK